MKETTNLYHWSLWWSIHWGYVWTLGMGPHLFVLRSCPLGLLAAWQKLGNNKEDVAADSPRWVETYEDAKETFGWDDVDAMNLRGNGFMWTIRSPVRLINGEMVSLPPNRSGLGDADELNERVQPPEATAPTETTEPTETSEPTDTAEVMSVTFKMDVECLPWYQIATALRRAQLDVLDANLAISQRFWYRCRKCGTTVTYEDSEADHIEPVNRFANFEQANTPTNLQILCLDCHREKTAEDR